MSDKTLGSTTTFYGEQIAHKWFPRGGDHHLYAFRDVTLSDDLSRIEARYLRCFRFYQKDIQIELSRDAAIWLRDALDKALAATEGDDVR